MDVENISPSPIRFKVGDLVDVEARTWPGINKLGGRGFVKSVNSDNMYTVAYVLGGKEDGVEVKYISKISENEETKVSRKRNQVQVYQQEEFRKPTTKKAAPVLKSTDNTVPVKNATHVAVTHISEEAPSSCDDSESIAESEVKHCGESSADIPAISREVADNLFKALRECTRLSCEGYLFMDISNYFMERMPLCETDDVQVALEAVERENKIMIVDDERNGRVVYVI